MLSYFCLKVGKIRKVKIQKLQSQEMEEQTVQYAIVKNQNFPNSKKLVGY